MSGLSHSLGVNLAVMVGLLTEIRGGAGFQFSGRCRLDAGAAADGTGTETSVGRLNWRGTGAEGWGSD